MLKRKTNIISKNRFSGVKIYEKMLIAFTVIMLSANVGYRKNSRKDADSNIRYNEGSSVSEIKAANEPEYSDESTVSDSSAKFAQSCEQVSSTEPKPNTSVWEADKKPESKASALPANNNQKFGIGLNGEILNIRFGLFSKTELTALDGSIIPAGGLIEAATPDEDGFICFAADMPYNAECYIKELETDEHYILSDEQYLNGDTAENKIIRGSIEGLKTDPNGRVLKGAVIGLFYPFETEFSKDTAIETFETDEAGRFLFENVAYGEWIIRELKAPDGYILSEENYTVTVKENGETVKLNIKNSKIQKPPSAPESPKTGDTANLLIPFALLLSALTAVICINKKLKKRGNQYE